MVPSSELPWIQVAGVAPYFITASCGPWTPIGHNSAITWPDISGGFARKDLGGLAAHLRMLVAHGVACIRLMLEYCRGEHRYFEQPAGRFKPRMVQYWDDMFRLCEKYGLRILPTPFDTFWMWIRWKQHPYNARNGGRGRKRNRLLLSANASGDQKAPVVCHGALGRRRGAVRVGSVE